MYFYSRMAKYCMKNHTVMKTDDLEFMSNHMDESHKHIVLKEQDTKKKLHMYDSNYMIQKQAKLNYIA